MKKVYNCFRCGKWFEKAKVMDHGQFGKVEVCPFCGHRVYQTGGITKVLVSLWWWLKELFLSALQRWDL